MGNGIQKRAMNVHPTPAKVAQANFLNPFIRHSPATEVPDNRSPKNSQATSLSE